MIAHPLKVRELLDEIARGEVVLPEFQRAYVWKPSQVVRLLDSLYQGYPTGQILLWDPSGLPTTRGLEGVERSGLPAPGRPKVVLDGQQRLTSLHRALAPDAKEPVEVSFHLRRQEFALWRERHEQDPYWVPLRAVLNQELHDLDVLQRIAAAGGPGLDTPEARTFLDRLQALRRIAEYRFPIEVWKSDDYEQVTELFVRINSGGTRLHRAELILAELALRLPGTLTERFEEASELYAEAGFPLDTRFFVRALVAVGTGQARLTNLGKLLSRPPAELDAVWKKTRRGLDRAVAFVRHSARIASAEWLSSHTALVPLTAWFAGEPQLTREVEVGLLRWFYVALLRGRYSGATETALDEDLKALAAERPVLALLDRTLEAAGGALGVDPGDLGEADWRNPLFPLTYVVARKAGAEDWFSGEPLTPRAAGGAGGTPSRAALHVHPVFPRALLRRAGVPLRQREEIANLVFLAAPPDEALQRVGPEAYLADLAARHPERLKAQSIPLRRELWRVERYPEFLAARRDLLAAAINALIDDPL